LGSFKEICDNILAGMSYNFKRTNGDRARLTYQTMNISVLSFCKLYHSWVLERHLYHIWYYSTKQKQTAVNACKDNISSISFLSPPKKTESIHSHSYYWRIGQPCLGFLVKPKILSVGMGCKQLYDANIPSALLLFKLLFKLQIRLYSLIRLFKATPFLKTFPDLGISSQKS
jgi:hypothetical protein